MINDLVDHKIIKITIKEIIIGKKYRYRFWLNIFISFALHYSGVNVINIYSYYLIEKHESKNTSLLFVTLMPLMDLLGTSLL